MNHQMSVVILITVLLSTGCASTRPKNPDNLCSIFKEKRSWYKAAVAGKKKWGVPVHVPMAMMYQESSFKYNAAPPMRYFLWYIPIGRASSAYGYAQAKTATWDDYVKQTGNTWSSRKDFADAMDFMGWFINKSYKLNGVSKWDAKNQYLNYHEGWGGFRRKSYMQKKWLIRVADKVDSRSKSYANQYQSCKSDLADSWLWRLFFGWL